MVSTKCDDKMRGSGCSDAQDDLTSFAVRSKCLWCLSVVPWLPRITSSATTTSHNNITLVYNAMNYLLRIALIDANTGDIPNEKAKWTDS